MYNKSYIKKENNRKKVRAEINHDHCADLRIHF